MKRGSRDGISFVEVLIAAFVAMVLALPIVSLLVTTTHEAVVSEDYMFAEALAQRALAEAMRIPWEKLEPSLPLTLYIGGVPSEDWDIAKANPEYQVNLSGPASFRGALTATLAGPDLVLYEVAVTWPVRLGRHGKRCYALTRFRCRHDIALRTNYAFRAGGGGRR